ncbi:MAG: primase-helicase family protein [Candidatus Thorarchaeota archaeon]
MQCIENRDYGVRHTISNEFYQDVDMVNAHPVILSYLCKQNNIECKWLNKYIAKREHYLKLTKLNRDKAKQKYLALTNCDETHLNYSKITEVLQTKHLKLYKDEMKNLHSQFKEIHLEQFEEEKKNMIEYDKKTGIDKKNYNGRFMNILLCEMENKILMEMWNYFGSPSNCVLCFDGLMLPKDKTYDIEGCQTYINQKFKNLNMKLKIKPMNKIMDLPIQIKQHEDISIDGYFTFNQFAGKEITKELLDEWLDKNIKYISNNGDPFFITNQKNKRILGDKSTQEYNNWCIVREGTLARDLRINCCIVNPNYDYEFSQQFYEMKKKDQRLVSEEDKKKVNKSLFPSIGFGDRWNPGYMEYMVSNRFIGHYNNIEFYPYLSRLGVPDLLNAYNTFQGFPLEHINIEYKDMNFEETDFYQHYKTEFFDNDEKENHHFWACIADIIQDPANIKGISHVFYSKQGMGKGLLAEFLIRILGVDNVAIIDDIDRYLKNSFNKATSNKLVKIFEEVSEKGNAFKEHNRLKSEQTKSIERIEPKNVDPFENRHCARYIYFSNNENTLYVENDDRRHTMHRVNNRYANNYTYFKPLWDCLKDKKFLKCAFEYLANYKYDDFTVRRPYNTQYKKDQKRANLPNGIKFIIDYIENEYEDGIVSSVYFKNKYKEYCTDQGIKYNLNTLWTQIKKIKVDKPKKRYKNKNQYWSVIISKNEILNSLRTYLNEPEFNFEETEIIEETDEETTTENEEEETISEFENAIGYIDDFNNM